MRGTLSKLDFIWDNYSPASFYRYRLKTRRAMKRAWRKGIDKHTIIDVGCNGAKRLLKGPNRIKRNSFALLTSPVWQHIRKRK
jgi:hypothetical protein